METKMNKHKKTKSYKEIVKIPQNLKKDLPTSFDVIGDILLIKLKDNIIKYKEEIAKALLKNHKNIKTVCLIHPVSGELRTRKIEIIGGEKRTKTIHKEYGLNFAIDIKKAYFSTRLANERKRIMDQVKNNEIIIDMFTGVAPFSIMIAKYAKPKIIYAFDKNKDAIKYAKENIKINNVLDKVEAVCIDALNIPNYLKEKNVKADRIIMNLPFSVFDFFPKALQTLKNDGAIHYYEILTDESLDERINELKEIAKKQGYILAFNSIRKIKSYSPREFYIGIDITAKRKKDADVA
jgi:tRNA (guanine37-N1)-methyltransferase